MGTPVATPIPQQLAELTGKLALAAYTGAKLHLASNAIAPDQNTPLSAFTECVFTGYSASVLTYGAPFIDTDGNAYAICSNAVFLQTGTGALDNAQSWFLTDSGGTVLLASGAIDGGNIPFQQTGDGATLSLKFGFHDSLSVEVTL